MTTPLLSSIKDKLIHMTERIDAIDNDLAEVTGNLSNIDLSLKTEIMPYLDGPKLAHSASSDHVERIESQITKHFSQQKSENIKMEKDLEDLKNQNTKMEQILVEIERQLDNIHCKIGKEY